MKLLEKKSASKCCGREGFAQDAVCLKSRLEFQKRKNQKLKKGIFHLICPSLLYVNELFAKARTGACPAQQ